MFFLWHENEFTAFTALSWLHFIAHHHTMLWYSLHFKKDALKLELC